MSNSSCASATDLDRFGSWNFLLSQYAGLCAGLITHVSSLYAAPLVFRKSIFELSTKILLLQSIFFSNVFHVCHTIEAVVLVYKSFFKRNYPCELLESEADCGPYFKCFLFATTGMIYGQAGLLIERACATFLNNYPKERRWKIGCLIFCVVFILSGLSGPMIVWDDPLRGYGFACFVIPKQSVPRASHFYVFCTILTLCTLVLTRIIMKHNKKSEYANRFQVGARFQKRQAIDSTGTICFMALSLFVLLLIYSIGICVLLNIRSMIPAVTFNFLIAWCYTIPYVSMMIPLLIIYRVRSTRAIRALNIIGITSTIQTQDDHIQQMNNMWN